MFTVYTVMYIYYQGQSSHKLCIKIRSIVLATCPVQANYVQCKPGHCLSVELGKQSTKHRKRINQPQEKDQLTTGKRSSIHKVVFTVAMNMKTILYPVSSLHTKKVNRTSYGDNGRTITIQTLIFLFRAEPSRQ